jgi:release factor glutamine methyltransferase
MLLEKILNKYDRDKNVMWEIAEECLNLSKERIIAFSKEITVSPQQAKKIDKIFLKYHQGTPLAYCLKRKYFLGYKFYVNNNTLIPRPETEILVNEAIALMKNMKGGNIIDIGTGCGNIIISLYKQSGTTKTKNYFFAVDKSKKALKVAMRNASRLNAKKINFLQSDLFSNKKLPKKFEMILANLPYLEKNYLKNLPANLSKPLSYEPAMALSGGKKGSELISRLIKKLKEKISAKGICLIELGDNQAQQIIKICTFENLDTKQIKDLNGFTRFLEIKKRIHQV